MPTGSKRPSTVGQEQLQPAEENGAAGAAESRKVPVAYEEVVLTEEAAALLEQMRQEKVQAEQLARKPRRIPTANESATDN